jgi:hypothetical protein
VALSSEDSTKGPEIQPGLFSRRSYTITFSTQKPNRRKKFDLDFVVHIDNSMCHNARKISLELEHNKIEQAPTRLILPISARVNFGIWFS